MWVVNVIVIVSAIAAVSWLVWKYGDDIGSALGFFFSGSQSVLVALGVLLREAFKGAVIAAVVGGAVYLIFTVAGAPDYTTKASAISIGSLAFALFMIKALWEIFTNLRWAMRNEYRNRYRRR
jgi:hypothetical protein